MMYREVQTTETAGHRHAHQTRLAASVKILLRALGIYHAAILHAGTVVIHILCVLGDDVAADLTDDIEHAVIAVHSVLEILWCVVEFVRIGEVSLLELHNLLHHRMIEVKFQSLVICIEISHLVYLEFFL